MLSVGWSEAWSEVERGGGRKEGGGAARENNNPIYDAGND